MTFAELVAALSKEIGDDLLNLASPNGVQNV